MPKTIDNDIVGTEVTFGFHTAVQIATDAIDRLHTTAESHDRVMVVEVMGRHAGWIATYAGIAGGGDRHPRCPSCPSTSTRSAPSSSTATSVAATRRSSWWRRGPSRKEGTMERLERPLDRYGHPKLGGIAHVIAPGHRGADRLRHAGRALGHVQRGGTPNAYDRVLSTRYGLAAIDAVHDKAWGEMVVYREMRIERAPLRLALGRTRTLDLAMYEDVASIFFG